MVPDLFTLSTRLTYVYSGVFGLLSDHTQTTKVCSEVYFRLVCQLLFFRKSQASITTANCDIIDKNTEVDADGS